MTADDIQRIAEIDYRVAQLDQHIATKNHEMCVLKREKSSILERVRESRREPA
jgi:hypothetical protein